MTNYGDLFRIKNNNNEESIFSWQWIVDGGYQDSNFSNVQYGPDVLNEVSYGATYLPSKDIIKAFEVGDKRRKESIMMDGDYYPELTHDGGVGFTCSKANGFLDATGGLVKKYVVGKTSAETGIQDEWGGTSACNYIMRYSDLLLIHAEAIMAGNAETSDPAALLSFNKVRNRAGLPSKTKITHDDMIHERRVELAFEGEYWYDLGRLPASEAISIMSQQDRSAYSTTPANYTPTEADLIYPKPSNDVNKNPKLNEPAVPYVFK
jgi:starch-binding outer membrane protein, SusD/RagB family